MRNSMNGKMFIALLLCVFLSEGSHVVQITKSVRNQTNPAIYSSAVVWEDDRNGNWDIYGYTILSQEEFPITINGSNQYDPAIYENYVVWMDERNGNYDIYGYNIMTQEEFPLIVNESSQINPAVYKDYVVWQDYRNGNWDIYGFNLLTGTEFPITTNGSNQTNPAIYETMVVWQDYRNGNWDIYEYDLLTFEETQITTNANNQTNPAVHRDVIVWEDDRNGNYDIYGYTRLQEVQITADQSNQTNPAVYSSTVVWEDDRNGNYDIYKYDLSTQEEFQITTDSYDQRNPAIYGTIIVWEDGRQGNTDIYGFNLPMTSVFTLTVTVIDTDGNPISKASVTLGPYTGLTDETGVAAITNIAGGSYTLTVSAAGYQGYTQLLSITGNETVIITLERETSEPGAQVSVAVTVKDTVQNPVSGATVTLVGPSTYTGITDTQGDVAFFNVVSGSYTLSVSAKGYQDWAQPVEVTTDDIISITLVSNLSVTITAQTASEKPVPGAPVAMTGPATYTDTADAQGKVTFSHVVHGTYTLTVSHPDYGTYTDSAFQVTTNDITTVVKLNPEMGFIHGTVHWDTVETPAKNVAVRIYDQAIGVLQKEVTTDFEGRFIVEVPNAKKYYIIVEDFVEQKYVGISPTNSLARGALTLIIDSECRVKGVVINEAGEEIAGADITLKDTKDQVRAQGTTDSSGLFTIKVTPGTYSIEIAQQGYLLSTQTFTVSHKEIYNLGTVTLKKKPEPRIDVPEESPPVETPELPSKSLMVPVLITLGTCILVVVIVVIRAKNRSDLAKTVLISVFTGIIAIIAMWILFQIG